MGCHRIRRLAGRLTNSDDRSAQPPEKSYRDFNENWPLDSWSVSEPDDMYQAHYVRLLSKFVP
jgi:hypothetical protein